MSKEDSIEMLFLKSHKKNFDTLCKAVNMKHVCLIYTTIKKTDEPVAIICMINYNKDSYDLIPIATLFNEDPYEILTPLSNEEGIEHDKKETVH